MARWGTYITTPGLATTLRAGHATVRARTLVVNESDGRKPVTVVSTVKDPDGHMVVQAHSTLAVGAGETRTATQELRIDRPRLWSFDAPERYVLETELPPTTDSR